MSIKARQTGKLEPTDMMNVNLENHFITDKFIQQTIFQQQHEPNQLEAFVSKIQ